MTNRVGSWEVVTTHDFHVGFLQQRHPQLIAVVGVRTQKLSVPAQGQEVVNYHLIIIMIIIIYSFIKRKMIKQYFYVVYMMYIRC